MAYAALYVLQIFDTKFLPLRKQLADNVTYFRTELAKLGFIVGGDADAAIVPIFFADEQQTVKAADALYEQGIYVRAFTYPVVPKGKARIRVQISAAHTKEHLDKALGAFKKLQ